MQNLDPGLARTKEDRFHLGCAVGAEGDLARAQRLFSVPNHQQRLASRIASLVEGNRGGDPRIGHGPGGHPHVAQLHVPCAACSLPKPTV